MSKDVRDQLTKIQKFSELLTETIIPPKIKPNFLYHGTHIKNLDSIQKYGLIPDFGDTVKSTQAYQHYFGDVDDDGYEVPERERIDGILFFSDNPKTWSYSHYGGTPNIDEALLVIIAKNDTIFRKGNQDDFYDMRNQRVRSINYIDVDELPQFIERGDYFSLEGQKPLYILYGERLKNFLKSANI